MRCTRVFSPLFSTGSPYCGSSQLLLPASTLDAFRVRDVERGALPTPGDGNVGIAVCADGVTTKSGGQDDRRDQWERPRGKASKIGPEHQT